MKEAVIALFDKRIAVTFSGLKENGRDEILRAAMTHERKGECIDNVIYQLRLLKLQRQMTKKNFVDIVYSCADMYCAAILEYLKQQILSQAERQRRIDEANRIANFEAEVEADQKELTDPRIKSYPGAAARRGLEI